MNWRLFGCEKFRVLSSESVDRQLSSKELRFLEKHRTVCIECVRIEDQSASALDMLRSITLEAHATPMFEERVMRRLKISRARESFRYWSPSVIGASIACVAICSALQIVLVASAKNPGINSPTFDGKRMLKPRSENLPALINIDRPDRSGLRETGIRQ